jgi:predicted SprT family Zn-dependent metalloprotease
MIGLNRLIGEHGSEELITHIMKHEIAHVLTPEDGGHGPAWKAKCIELGIKPTRCTESKEGAEIIKKYLG